MLLLLLFMRTAARFLYTSLTAATIESVVAAAWALWQLLQQPTSFWMRLLMCWRNALGT